MSTKYKVILFSLYSIFQLQYKAIAGINPDTLKSHVTNKVWKINQMYVDSMVVVDTAVYNIKYKFNANNTFELGRVYKFSNPNFTWSFNYSTQEISIFKSDSSILQKVQVVYLDKTNFIFIYLTNDTKTGNLHKIEYRLIPDI